MNSRYIEKKLEETFYALGMNNVVIHKRKGKFEYDITLFCVLFSQERKRFCRVWILRKIQELQPDLIYRIRSLKIRGFQ